MSIHIHMHQTCGGLNFYDAWYAKYLKLFSRRHHHGKVRWFDEKCLYFDENCVGLMTPTIFTINQW